MQQRFLQNGFIFLLLCLSFSCKKEIDEYGPVVTIHTPASSQSFHVFDNVHVTADVTDDTKITSVTISLVALDYTPLGTGLHLPVSSPSMSINANYTLDNIHLESGLYFLMITASDGTNDSRTYQQIYITAVPEVLSKIFVTTGSSSSSTNLSYIDSSFTTLNPYHTFPGDYLGAAASSYYQQVYMCGSYTGALTSMELQTNNITFSVPVPISGNPYFTAFYSEDKRNYVGRYDGLIKGYNNTGDVVYTATATTGYYATDAIMSDGHLVAAEQSKISSSGKLLVSYFTTGAALQQTPLSQDVVTMCNQDDNNVFLFGNNSGQGVIQLFDRINNNIWNPYNYSLDPGTILSAVKIDPNTYLIGHSNGTIYKYQFMSSSVTAYLTGYTAIQLKYDDLNNRIYIVEQNRISAVDYPSATYIHSVASAENIKDVSLLYNR